MSIGSPMTSTIPPVGTAGTGYASDINAFLAEVQSLLEAQIPLSSLLIGTLDMQNNAITEVQRIGLYQQLTAPATVGSLQNYQGDLYWVNAAGAVKITDADSLNASGIGGITGDYGGSNPAQWRFDDADQAFYGYDDYAAAKWAHVRARDFGMYGAYGGTTRITLTGTAAASYTVTFPTALPGATSVVTLSATGQLAASNTLPNSINAPDYGFSTQRVISLGGSAGMTANSGSPPTYSGTTNVWTHGTSTSRITFQLPVNSGDTIVAWTAYLTKTSATGTVGAELYKYTLASGARSQIGSTVSNGTNAPGDITLNATGLSETVDSAHTYFISIVPSGTTGDFTNAVSVNVTRTV